MAKVLVLCLILTDAFLFLSMADDRVASNANPPASSPHYNSVVEGSSNRKIGKIWMENGGSHELVAAGGQDTEQQQSHRRFDKSVCGGGVILGGLATTFLVAVFCYIRATRKGRENVSDSPSSSPSASPKITDTSV